MSGDQKSNRPPTINLGSFKPPEEALPPPRPSFYSEESTMITSLSDLERQRVARGELHSSPKASVEASSSPMSPPLPRAVPSIGSRPSLESLNQPSTMDEIIALNPAEAFEETNQISPQELQALQESGVTSETASTPLDLLSEAQSELLGTDQTAGIVAVFNARGGVGATTLAVNLAGAAGALGQRVALIDLDLQLGSVTSMLDGKKLERSLAELLMEASESADHSIKSAIDERSGISIIAQEGRIGEIGMVTPDRLPAFIEAVKKQHGLVVIDGLRGFSDQAVTALDSADVILLVITQDIPALRSAKHVLSLFKRLGYDRSKVRLVLNRYQKKSSLSVDEIAERLDHSVYEVLDNSFPFVSSLIEEGRLARDVNLKHKVTKGFDRLASRLLGLEMSPNKRGLFGFFSKGRRS